MSYCTGCSIRCPGHIVILIDGAANMATYYMDNETRISFVEDIEISTIGLSV